MINGAKLVSKAIVGLDFVGVVVGGKSYTIHPPTIKKIAGASVYLADIEEAETIASALRGINNAERLSKALSWLIAGDDSLHEDLLDGTVDEVVDALTLGYSLISVENFTRLSTLLKSVERMIAKRRQ